MAPSELTPDDNPLTRLKIENEKGLIRKLNITQVFGTEHSDDAIAEAIAPHHLSKCSSIGGKDVGSIFSYLKANPDCENNSYTRLKEAAAKDQYGDRIQEVQDTLKEWDVDIDMAKRK